MRHDQVTDDRQAETAATGAAAAGLLRAPETVEDVRQVVRRDTGAGVGDLQQHVVAVAARRQRDGAVRGCVAQGVGDQVAQRLPHPHRVGVQPRRALEGGAQGDPGGVGRDAVGRGYLVEEFVAAHRLRVQAQGAGVGVGEVAQVVDDTLQHEGLVVQ